MASGGLDPLQAAAAAAGRPADFTWIVVVGGITCFLTAFAIGANDVANTFSSSVGSRALPLWVAICLAAVLETVGATLLGGAVTDSIRSKIIDFEVFAGAPTVLMSGMLCSLIGAGGWLFLANKFGLPVSTTHAIIGALLGFGLASGNVHAVRWGQVTSIVLSWLFAPLVASCVGGSLFALLRAVILRKPNSLQRAKRGLWFLLWLMTLTFSVFLVFKNYFEIDCECWQVELTDVYRYMCRQPSAPAEVDDGHVGLASALAFGLSVLLTVIITWLVYRFAAARLAVYRQRHPTGVPPKAEAAAADASTGGGRRGGAGQKSAGTGTAVSAADPRVASSAAAAAEAETRAAAGLPAGRGSPAAAAACCTGTAVTPCGCLETGDFSQAHGLSYEESACARRQQQLDRETEAVCARNTFLRSSSSAAAALFSPCVSPLRHEETDTSAAAADLFFAASASAAGSASDLDLPKARASHATTSAADTVASVEDSHANRVSPFSSGRHGPAREGKRMPAPGDRPVTVSTQPAAAEESPEKAAATSLDGLAAPRRGSSNSSSRRLGAPYAFLAGRRRRNRTSRTAAATDSSIRKATGSVGEATSGRRAKRSPSSTHSYLPAASPEVPEHDPSTAAPSNGSRLRGSFPSTPQNSDPSSQQRSSQASDVATQRAVGGLADQDLAGTATPGTAIAAPGPAGCPALASLPDAEGAAGEGAAGRRGSSLRERAAVRAAAPAAAAARTGATTQQAAAAARGRAAWRSAGRRDRQTDGEGQACFTEDQQHQRVQRHLYPQQQDQHGQPKREQRPEQQQQHEQRQWHEQEEDQQSEKDRLGDHCPCVMVVVEQQHGQVRSSQHRGEQRVEQGEALSEAAGPAGSEGEGRVGGAEDTSSTGRREGGSSSSSSLEKLEGGQRKQTPAGGPQEGEPYNAVAATTATAGVLHVTFPHAAARTGEKHEAATAGTRDRQAAATAPPLAEESIAELAACCVGAAAAAAAAAPKGGGEGTAGVGLGCAAAAATGACMRGEMQVPQSTCIVDGEEEDEVCSAPGETSVSGWQKRLHTCWRTMPWFRDIHAEGQTEDELVARLQSGAEVFEAETEIFFSACQVVSACMGCIAHSANDTANAIGPFAAVLTIYQTGVAASQVESPWYVLLFGGLSMSLGLALLGYKVIKTVGVKLVKITPARGFAMDLGAAWTVLVFSALGIPLSTTHCAVGSTVGVGLMEPRQQQKQTDEEEPQHLLLLQQQKQEQRERGKHRQVKALLRKMPLLGCSCLNVSSVNWKLFGGVFVSWIVTILLSGLVSAGLFSFAAYSPRLLR